MKFKIKNLKFNIGAPRDTSRGERGAKSGFTLIEILIASAIFTAIVVLSVGAFTDSISFGTSSGQDRVVRNSARTFLDFFTLQLRAAGSSRIKMLATDYQLASGGSPTTEYDGTSFLLVNGFVTGQIKLPDVTTGGAATGIIIPTPSDTQGYAWMYLGKDPAGSAALGMWRMQAVGPDATQIPRYDPATWKSAGQFLSSEASLVSLKFSGINAQGTVFDNNPVSATNGQVLSYGVQAQPYVTITMQLAPISDATLVSSYQTSITSRDYKFAYPQCSKFTDPTVGCQ